MAFDRALKIPGIPNPWIRSESSTRQGPKTWLTSAAAVAAQAKRPWFPASIRGLFAFIDRSPGHRTPRSCISECIGKYKLVRRERKIVGPTSAAPYPIHHETVIATSDSAAELRELRERIRIAPCGSTAMSVQPDAWVDRVPGEMAFVYEIREK